MKRTLFDPCQDLIRISGIVHGPTGEWAELNLAVDTGATITTIDTGILDDLGYSARDGEAIAKISSAVADELGYLIRVATLDTLGYSMDNVLVHAHDLPPQFEIHGLVGLNFLRQFNCELRFGDGELRLTRPRRRTGDMAVLFS